MRTRRIDERAPRSGDSAQRRRDLGNNRNRPYDRARASPPTCAVQQRDIRLAQARIWRRLACPRHDVFSAANGAGRGSVAAAGPSADSRHASTCRLRTLWSHRTLGRMHTRGRVRSGELLYARSALFRSKAVFWPAKLWANARLGPGGGLRAPLLGLPAIWDKRLSMSAALADGRETARERARPHEPKSISGWLFRNRYA
jgi:hypothetical protein